MSCCLCVLAARYSLVQKEREMKTEKSFGSNFILLVSPFDRLFMLFCEKPFH